MSSFLKSNLCVEAHRTNSNRLKCIYIYIFVCVCFQYETRTYTPRVLQDWFQSAITNPISLDAPNLATSVDEILFPFYRWRNRFQQCEITWPRLGNRFSFDCREISVYFCLGINLFVKCIFKVKCLLKNHYNWSNLFRLSVVSGQALIFDF